MKFSKLTYPQGGVYREYSGRQYAGKKSCRRQTREEKIAGRQTPVNKSSRRLLNGIPPKRFSRFRAPLSKSYCGLCIHDNIPPYDAKIRAKSSQLFLCTF